MFETLLFCIWLYPHGKLLDIKKTNLDNFDDKAEWERESGKDENDADDDHQVGAHSLTLLASWEKNLYNLNKVESMWDQDRHTLIDPRHKLRENEIKI